MREASNFGQILDKIRRGVYWSSDDVMDEIPIIGPFLRLQY